MATSALKHYFVSSILMLVFLRKNAVLGDIGCLDNDGNPVDWFVVMKIPKLDDSQHDAVRRGAGQLYMDENHNKLTLLDKGIDEVEGHAVYNTLQQIYSNQNKQDVAYLLYNDQIPAVNQAEGKPHCSDTGKIHGHTKGDFCFDKSTGFWLVHSVPCLGAESETEYRYPKNGFHNGQSFFCVTYNYDQLDIIAQQQLYNHPYQVYKNAPKAFLDDNPHFAQLIDDEAISEEPWNRPAPLTSSGGHKFTSFAKARQFGKDLYEWVADALESDVYVETWQHGQIPFPSICDATYQVINVDSLTYLDGDISFSESQDHSKWAVTFGNHDDIICIGDINRHHGQEIRGGGTVCTQLPAVAKELSKAISGTQPCPNTTRNIEL